MFLPIIWIILRFYQKKYRLHRKNNFRDNAKAFLFLPFILTATLKANAQERELIYNINRNGDKVGIITINESKEGNRTTFQLNSEVSVRLIFRFKAKAMEKAVYENGVLRYSFVYKKVNNTERTNKETKLSGNGYI